MSEAKFINPAYRIETERLIVRCYQPPDARLLAESVSENVEHLKTFMPWVYAEPEPFEEKEKRILHFRGNFDLQENYVYGIFNKEETKLLGGTGLHPRIGEDQLEIGYWIHKDHIRKGYATEITSALIKVAFEIIHVHRIEIHCDPRNTASASVPRKLGFTHEGTLRAKTPFLDRWSDTMVWGLLKDEYPNSLSFKAQIKVFDAYGNLVL